MIRWKVVTRPVDEPDEEAGETGTIFEYVIRCGNEEVAVSYDEQRAAQIVRDHNAMLTLESLTPGGSEYAGDPEKCAEYIRWIKISAIEANKAVVRVRHNRAEAFEAMQEALNDIEQESSRRKYGIPNARLRRRVSDIAKTALALVGRTHNE